MGRHWLFRAITLLLVLQLISSGRVLSQEHQLGRAEPRAILAGNGNHAIQCLAFSPDKQFLAVARFGNVVEIWNIAACQITHTLRGHDIWAREMVFNPDGKLLAIAGLENTVSVWDIRREKQVLLLRGHEREVYTVAFRPGGDCLATGSRDQTARIWDSATGQEGVVFQGHARQPDSDGFILNGWVSSITFAPDGKRVASASNFCNRDWKIGHIKIWETTTGKELVSIEGAADLVRFDAQGRRIASSNWDGLTIWDATTGRPISSLGINGGEFHSIAFTQEGRCLAALCNPETVKVMDASNKTELLTVPGCEDRIAALSNDGCLSAS
jgi:WD40 repeat protein